MTAVMELRSEGFDSDQLSMLVMGHTIFPDDDLCTESFRIPGCIIFGSAEMEPRLNVTIKFHDDNPDSHYQVSSLLPASLNDVDTFHPSYYGAFAGNSSLCLATGLRFPNCAVVVADEAEHDIRHYDWSITTNRGRFSIPHSVVI